MTPSKQHLKRLVEKGKHYDISEMATPCGSLVSEAKDDFALYFDKVPQASILLRAYELEREYG